MLMIHEETNTASHAENDELTFSCPECSGILFRVNGTLSCEDCGHVPNHGAD